MTFLALYMEKTNVSPVAVASLCVCPATEYYMNCEIQFMGLANIHSIRKSFYALRTLCSGMPDQQGYVTFCVVYLTIYLIRLITFYGWPLDSEHVCDYLDTNTLCVIALAV